MNKAIKAQRKAKMDYAELRHICHTRNGKRYIKHQYTKASRRMGGALVLEQTHE